MTPRRGIPPLVLLITALVSCRPDNAPPALVFWDELRSLCGRAFPGAAAELTPADSAIAGEPLVLHLWQCWNDEFRIAFHVGDDHSRVWLLSRDDDGLNLTHAVHREDGSPADPARYGGPAIGPGSATRHTFAPDDETLLRFPSARGSTWTLELVPDERFSYSFDPADAGGRFRIDFDLTRSAPRPPSPWGWTRATRPTQSRSPADPTPVPIALEPP